MTEYVTCSFVNRQKNIIQFSQVLGPQMPSSRNNALWSPKMRPPKIGGPVWPNTSNMPMAGPENA